MTRTTTHDGRCLRAVGGPVPADLVDPDVSEPTDLLHLRVLGCATTSTPGGSSVTRRINSPDH